VPDPVAGTALLVEELLGSVLSSVVKAQGMVATQLAEFIERVGFEPREDEDQPLRARTFSFEFARAEVTDDDTVVDRRVTATLPLLSIVSLPALSIESADIGMDLRLVATEATDDSPSAGRPSVFSPVRPLRLWAVTGRPAVLPAVGFGTPSTTTTSSSVSGTVSVRVSLRRVDLPLGLERVERLLADGYTEEVEDGLG
jgi:hypothetical protein